MRMLFDFEGEEIVYVIGCILKRIVQLTAQGYSLESDREIQMLTRFALKLDPVVEAGLKEADNEHKAQMN